MRNKAENSDLESARQILDIVPRTMRIIRAELRLLANAELSVPQFRILVHLSEGMRNNGQLAEMQGVSVAAMSRMVDGLVRRGLITRNADENDRRQICLELTDEGRKLVKELVGKAQKSIARRIASLEDKPKQALGSGLTILSELFP